MIFYSAVSFNISLLTCPNSELQDRICDSETSDSKIMGDILLDKTYFTAYVGKDFLKVSLP